MIKSLHIHMPEHLNHAQLNSLKKNCYVFDKTIVTQRVSIVIPKILILAYIRLKFEVCADLCSFIGIVDK